MPPLEPTLLFVMEGSGGWQGMVGRGLQKGKPALVKPSPPKTGYSLFVEECPSGLHFEPLLLLSFLDFVLERFGDEEMIMVMLHGCLP